MHGLTACIVLATQLPLLLQLAILLVLSLNLSYYYQQYRGFQPGLLKLNYPNMHLQQACRHIHAEIYWQSFVSPWFIVLLFKQPQRRLKRKLIIWPDMLPPQQFRQLCVYLNTR